MRRPRPFKGVETSSNFADFCQMQFGQSGVQTISTSPDADVTYGGPVGPISLSRLRIHSLLETADADDDEMKCATDCKGSSSPLLDPISSTWTLEVVSRTNFSRVNLFNTSQSRLPAVTCVIFRDLNQPRRC